MSSPKDDDIETDSGHRLTLWRRFGSAAFKSVGSERLLGWDPASAVLHLNSLTGSSEPVVESWDALTGERLAPTSFARNAAVAGLAIDAACSPFTVRRGEECAAELWDLRAGRLLATLPDGTWDEGVVVSADARLAVYCHSEMDVYALPGGELVGSLPGNRRPVAVSPDGSLIVSRDRELDHLTVSRPDGTPVSTLPLSSRRRATAAGFSRDGLRVIVGLDDGEVACWEVATGDRLWSARPHGDAPRGIVAVARSPDGVTFFAFDDGRRLCAISAAGEVRWRASLGNNPRTYVDSCQLLPSPDGARLAVSTPGRSPRIVDAATGADRTPVEGHRGRLVALAVSPDGRLAASTDDEGEVRVYDLARDEVLWTLEIEGGPVGGVEFGRDGCTLWTAGGDGHVRRWSLATGSEEARWPARTVRGGIVGARDGARRLVVLNTGLQLWSDRAGTHVQWSKGFERKRFEAAFSDAEARVVVAHFTYPNRDEVEWLVTTLDAEAGREVSAPEAVPGRLVGLRSTDDGPLSFTLAGERLVVREEFGARREVAAREASAAVSDVDVSADGRWMALADEEHVELWSLAPPARCVGRLRRVEGFGSVTWLALSADGGVLVVGTAFGVVTVYARRPGATGGRGTSGASGAAGSPAGRPPSSR